MQLWTRLHRLRTHCLGKVSPRKFSKKSKSSPRAQGRLVRFEINTHEVFSNECQSSLGESDGRVSLYKKVSRVLTRLQGEMNNGFSKNS